MNARIAVLPGDGIGPEVTDAAERVLRAVAEIFGHRWTLSAHPIGGAALRRGLPALPGKTCDAARSADAVLLGAVGDPAFDDRPLHQRPEHALLALRRALGVFANLRPARVWPGLEACGPLKPEILRGTDLIIVRELLGGLYYGEPRGTDADGSAAFNTLRYSRSEIARVARVAFRLAASRRGRVVSVDKANVLEVSRLWRDELTAIAREYPHVSLSHEYVDSTAMKLALMPASFDVLVMENMFGDILSDEAGAIAGSLGLLPSASLGDGPGLFEPVHGSAPALAGQGVANPVGAIGSVAMLLEHGLGLHEEARAIVAGLERTLQAGFRTPDIASGAARAVSTTAFTDAVVETIRVAGRKTACPVS